jgi:hypothetical protein
LAHRSVVTIGDMGQSWVWRWQFQLPLRNVQQVCGTADAFAVILCNSGRWNRSDLGRSGPWWWQLQSKISSGMSWRCVALGLVLLRFWQIEPWWPGAFKALVVTAPESKISFGTFSRTSVQKLQTKVTLTCSTISNCEFDYIGQPCCLLFNGLKFCDFVQGIFMHFC